MKSENGKSQLNNLWKSVLFMFSLHLLLMPVRFRAFSFNQTDESEKIKSFSIQREKLMWVKEERIGGVSLKTRR